MVIIDKLEGLIQEDLRLNTRAKMAELLRVHPKAVHVSGAIIVSEILSGEKTDRMSVSIVELDGINAKVKNTICDASYYILSGTGHFFTSDDKGDQMFKVNTGDLVYIPHDTIYHDAGKMRMLAIYTPAFSPDQVVRF